VKKTKRRPSGTPVKNDILRALPGSEYKHLSPMLERVDLKLGEIIYQADDAAAAPGGGSAHWAQALHGLEVGLMAWIATARTSVAQEPPFSTSGQP
jgi:hypothetical protein